MKPKKILAYQILNEFGHPASNESNDLCIFASVYDVAAFFEYLWNECGAEREELEKYTVIEVFIQKGQEQAGFNFVKTVTFTPPKDKKKGRSK